MPDGGSLFTRKVLNTLIGTQVGCSAGWMLSIPAIPADKEVPSGFPVCVATKASSHRVPKRVFAKRLGVGEGVRKCFLPKWDSTEKENSVFPRGPLRPAAKGCVLPLNGAPPGAPGRPHCKTQCASLSFFTFISSAFVFFFHFNFKTVIDHSGGQEPRRRHHLSPSSPGWQEAGTLKASTVCMWGES